MPCPYRDTPTHHTPAQTPCPLQPPRPLDIFVALRHKHTGATFAESYATVATVGMERPNNSREHWCHHDADALSAVITVNPRSNPSLVKPQSAVVGPRVLRDYLHEPGKYVGPGGD